MSGRRILWLFGLGGLVMAQWPPPTLGAQTRGATVPVAHTMTFSTSGQSMWGPANAPSNLDFTLTLFDEGWSEGGTTESIANALGTQWGGSIGGSTSGAVGLSFRIFDIGTGEVRAEYPVRVVLDVPEPNSFRAGETVMIGTRFEVLPGWALATSPPGGTLAINGRFGTSLSATGKVCFFGCSLPFDLLPRVNIPTDPFELLRVSSQGGITFPAALPLPRPPELQTLPYQFGALFDPIGGPLGFEGPVDAPRVTTAASLGGDGRSITAAGTHRFVDLSVDLDQYLTLLGVPPLGVQTNDALNLVTGASFGYDIADLALLLGISKRQTFTLIPRVTLTAGFPQPVVFAVLDAGGATVHAGTGQSVTFDVGHSLRIDVPGSASPIAGTPTYELRNRFRSASSFEFDERLVLSAGRFELKTPSKSVTNETTTTVCSLPWLEAVADVCNFFGGVLETITHAVTSTAPAVNVNLGPLAQETLVDEVQTAPLFPASGGAGEWELQGFQPSIQAPFLLDPEDPRITVITQLASAALAGGPSGAVQQVITVRNEGDVALSAAQLRDALTAAISGGSFGLLGVSAPTLSPNAAFDGASIVEVLDGADVLDVGEEGTVTIAWSVTPGNVYRAQVEASGTSPIGTAVADESSDALAVIAFEIIPDQVSAWSNGVLPVRILSDGIPASQIDAATVQLEGIPPSQWNLTSSGQLVLKYPLQHVLAELEQRLQSQMTVAAALGSASDVRSLGAVSVGDVGAAVLGESGRLSAEMQADVDRNGNANGRLDLGDLRRIVLAGRRAESERSMPGTPSFGAGVSMDHVLIATGYLVDGMRFIGEDDLSVMQQGGGQ